MSTPAEVVAEQFALANSYASNAQGQLSGFLAQLNSAIQLAPVVDLTFPTVNDPGTESPPSDLPTYTDPTLYTDGVLTSLASVIVTRLSGGTGLAPSVEAAIWDRARARELTIAQAAIDDVTVQAEALGFELPTGVLNEGIRRETNSYYEKVSGLSRDIMVKQAELEQSNMLKIVEQATAYEQMLAAIYKARADVAVDVFRAKIDSFRAEVQSFAAQVEQDVKHWEAQIKLIEAQANYTQENAKINSEIIRANLSAVLEAGKVGAQVYAQLVAAAYSLIHASAAVSASASDSVSYSYSNDTTTTVAPVTSV